MVFFDGLSKFVVTDQGSKPGDPLGDIIFASIIVKVLKGIVILVSRPTNVTWVPLPPFC